MSFLDEYLSSSDKLTAVSDKVKNALKDLEHKISNQTNESGGDFNECVKEFGPQLADLADRLKTKISSLSIKSFSDAWNIIKFAKNLGFEVYQITDNVKDCVFKDTPDSEKEAKELEFGKDLAYFVWLSVNPLNGKLTWLPFKTTLEKKLVRWIAGMAIELARDVLNKTVNKSETNSDIVKAI